MLRLIVLFMIVFLGFNISAGEGEYSLVKVQDFPARVPYVAIGLIKFSNGNCSGTVIAPNAVLTAAHCLYDLTAKKWEKVDYFKLSGPFRGGQGVKVKRLIVPKEYLTVPETLSNYSYDYALIILNDEISSGIASIFKLQITQTDRGVPILHGKVGPRGNVEDIIDEDSLDKISGIYPVGSFDDVDRLPDPLPNEESQRFVLVGFPGDPPSGSTGRMWGSFCPIVNGLIQDKNSKRFYRLLTYMCEGWGGTSGAPLFYQLSANQYRIIGIHSFGVDEGYSHGIPISSETNLRILQWIRTEKPNAQDGLYIDNP